MHYLKRNTKFSILAFLIIVLSVTISISTLAKTEFYFSLPGNPYKEIINNINKTEVFINISMCVFTNKGIFLPLINAQEREAKARVCLAQGQANYQYNQSRFLLQKGIKKGSANNYIMHYKFAF